MSDDGRSGGARRGRYCELPHPVHAPEWGDPGIDAAFEGVWRLRMEGLRAPASDEAADQSPIAAADQRQDPIGAAPPFQAFCQHGAMFCPPKWDEGVEIG